MPNKRRNIDAGLQEYIVLHSNDLHSCFENMPKIADAVEEYRAMVPPERLILIDCGDHMDRMRMLVGLVIARGIAARSAR